MATDRHRSPSRQLSYRRRLADAGEREVIFRLKGQTLAIIDEIKKRQGLSNRGQVLEHANSARELLKSLEQGRENTQHQQIK
jgi:hypothetical protein